MKTFKVRLRRRIFAKHVRADSFPTIHEGWMNFTRGGREVFAAPLASVIYWRRVDGGP